MCPPFILISNSSSSRRSIVIAVAHLFLLLLVVIVTVDAAVIVGMLVEVHQQFFSQGKLCRFSSTVLPKWTLFDSPCGNGSTRLYKSNTSIHKQRSQRCFTAPDSIILASRLPFHNSSSHYSPGWIPSTATVGSSVSINICALLLPSGWHRRDSLQDCLHQLKRLYEHNCWEWDR